MEAGRKIRVLEGQNAMLELVARGADLQRCLSRLAGLFGKMFPGALCSIALIDDDARKLVLAAAPDLSVAFEYVFERVDIGPGPFPCAGAAYRREPILISDIRTDPVWEDLAHIVEPLGLVSCWAHPILDRDARTLGTVSLYFREPQAPDDEDLEVIDTLMPLAVIASDHDRRARELKLADERLMSLAANLPGVVYQRVVRPDGDIRYTYISEGARDLFGVSAREIVENPQALFDCHGPEYSKDFHQRLLAASKEMKLWDVEAPIITRDGEQKWTHAIARPARHSDGSVVWSGIILDATRIKMAQLELAAANRAKSEFLANMSHELRTPLNAIIGFSDMMARGTFGDLGDPRYEEYARDIGASGLHLLDIINDILDVSKIEAGRMEINETSVDISRLIMGITRLFREKIQAHDITLMLDIDAEIPIFRGDERKLKQMLINLISNAVKFTPDGGKIGVAAQRSVIGDLVLRVSDTGIGISAEHLPKIFEPFMQVDGDLDRKFDGTGLGICLTKAMVELHGGVLEIDSELGEGTTATIRLPANRLDDGGRERGGFGTA